MAKLDYNQWQKRSEQVLFKAHGGDGNQIVAEGYTPFHAVMEGEMAEIVDKLLHADELTRRAILSEFDEEEQEWLLSELGSDDEEIAAEAAREIVTAIRVDTLQTLTRFVWQGARTPWMAVKNFLAVVRGVMPAIMGGIGVRQMAVVLNETPASTSAREKKLHAIAEEWGITGARISGVKTEEACDSYAAAQKGNRNRKGGKKVT